MSEFSNMGERLKKVRTDIGLTQIQFCELLKISRTSLVNYENNDRLMDARILADLHKIFSVDLNWLVGGDATSPYTTNFVTPREMQLLKDAGKLPENAYAHLAAFLSALRN